MDRETLAAYLSGFSAELREQISLITAAAHLLDRTASEQGKNHLRTLDLGVFRLMRTICRMELAYRLTDENEIRSFPSLVDLSPWEENLFPRIQGVLADAGITLETSAPSHQLINGDRELLTRMVLEMMGIAARFGRTVRLSVLRQGDHIHFSAVAAGEAPAGGYPDDAEEEFSLHIIRLIAQIHGGTLVTCAEGPALRSLTAILPQRLDMPPGPLASPYTMRVGEGLDPVRVALSHLLPRSATLIE